MREMLAAFVLGLFVHMTMPLTTAFAEDVKQPSGTIEIDEAQMAFIFSGTAGGGVLHYQGKSYEFTIGGAGLGGVGVSKVKAKGQVYDLENLADFAGVYGEARAGVAVADKSAGGLWLKNDAGVYLRLDAERKGLDLALGAEGLLVEMKE